MTHSRQPGVALGIALLILAGCASDKPRNEPASQAASATLAGKSEHEQVIGALKQQVAGEPENSDGHLALQVQMEQAVQALLQDADHARAAGHFDVAAEDYRRVQALSPDDSRAARGLELITADHKHAIDNAVAIDALSRDERELAAATVRGVLSEDPDNGTAKSLDRQMAATSGGPPIVPRLKTRDNRPVTLEFRDANTKMVFEVLSRQSGINFVFDKDVKGDGKTTIFVQDVPVEQAVDLVLTQNQLARQVLSDNMVLIYPKTAAKQKDYEDQIVKTFYLTNAAPKDVESMLKTVLDVKTMYVDERANVLVMRDTPDAVRMAEKLVASIDVPDSEVMMEVQVLEIGHNGLEQLGVAYPSQIVFTPSAAGGAAAAAATGGAASKAAGMVFNDLGRQTGDTVGISSLNLTLDFLKQNGTTNVLASPRIRARNKEKAKVLIGSRVPVITNSVTPTAGGTAVVTGNVQYVEVGLTLEVEPTIHMNNDVAIKVNLEVSSILKEVTVGTSGTLAYQIGTRNANTLLELKDGETQLLAGLVQDNDTHSASFLPGLGEIPYLGRLFGSHRNQKDKTELVLSITPHIIRMQPRATSEKTEFWYGTESNLRDSAPAAGGNGGVSDSSAKAAAPPSSPAAGSKQGAAAAAPARSIEVAPPPVRVMDVAPPRAPEPVVPSKPTSDAAPADAEPSRVAATPSAPLATVDEQQPIAVAPSPASAPQDERPSVTAAPPSLPGPVGELSVSLAGPDSSQVGQEFQVSMHLDSAQAPGRVRAQVKYDAGALRLLSAEAGDIMPPGKPAPRAQKNSGGVQLDLAGSADAPLQSSGDVVVMNFKSISAREAAMVAGQLLVLAPDGKTLANKAPSPLTVAVSQ